VVDKDRAYREGGGTAKELVTEGGFVRCRVVVVL
jgi:hypothetical protein